MTTAEPFAPTQRNKRKYIWLAILLLGLIVVGWLGLKTWRIARTAQSLLERRAEVETMAAGGLAHLDPERAEQLIMGVRQDVLTLKKEVAPFMPLMPHLGWVPKYGSTLVIAPQLLDLAEAGVDTAAYAVRGLKPALVVLQPDSNTEDSALTVLARTLAQAQPDLRAANESFARVLAAREAIGDTRGLPGQVQDLFAQADEWLPLAEDGLQFVLVAPQMMGIDGPRSYLIVAQNEDELRPTGGFISGAGIITMADGRIQDFSFTNAYNVDNYLEKPYDIPPEPLEKFMGLELFLFRDANFWPNFPTSAEKLMDLYSYGQDVPPLDGAIAIDQHFLQLLIEAIGPVTIAEDNLTLNASNLTSELRQAWGVQEGQNAQEWVNSRKDFLGPFAAAIKEKIETDFGSVDPVRLLTNMNTAVQTKHLQVYSRHPQTEAVLDELGWNGRLAASPDSDFLAVIDTNVGYSKANVYVEKTADYQVQLDGDGRASANLALHYTHTYPDNGQPCTHYNLAVYNQLPDYLTLAKACYWNYLRIYVPEGSQLITSTVHTIPGEAHIFDQTWQGPAQTLAETAGLTTFANYFLLPMGQTIDSQYEYQLPTVVTTDEDGRKTYQLTVQQQAGNHPYPLMLTVTLPEDTQLITAAPASTAVNGRVLQFKLTVDTDNQVTVQYR
ncbi:MAG: DUF4012 domain-containing protein [Ardenticatenaceae bacterium]|nr:DUF4012 domain-containing protein [Ardenticatenaceae bacterium]MCB8986666.1 DUF4012 domain-containing protein [Ardenticatenaceae bacterium]